MNKELIEECIKRVHCHLRTARTAQVSGWPDLFDYSMKSAEQHLESAEKELNRDRLDDSLDKQD